MRSVYLLLSSATDSQLSAELCRRLGLTVASIADIPRGALYLSCKDNLWTINLHDTPAVRLTLDGSSNNWSQQQIRKGFRQSLLIKAIGNKPTRVLDACAGFGRDSMIMAAFGHQVTSCERNPLVHFLAQQLVSAQTNIELLNRDACDLLSTQPEYCWLVIYLDPMYPETGKAQVRKSSRILREIVEPSPQQDGRLLTLARQHCRKLVVKRHIHAPFLNEQKPDIQYRGKSTRYDVYLRDS